MLFLPLWISRQSIIPVFENKSLWEYDPKSDGLFSTKLICGDTLLLLSDASKPIFFHQISSIVKYKLLSYGSCLITLLLWKILINHPRPKSHHTCIPQETIYWSSWTSMSSYITSYHVMIKIHECSSIKENCWHL